MMLAYAQPTLAPLLGTVYLLIGGAVGWKIHRDEPDLSLLLGAVVAWPVFLPLLQKQGEKGGPLRGAIDEVFHSLAATLAEPTVESVGWEVDLAGLRCALHRSDERLALVDRLLVDTPETASAPLRLARERAVAEIEDVLAEVLQLRLQIGLAALAGDNRSVREQLAELLDRVKALDEVTRFDG